jgi:hypothetical protein
MTIEVYAAADFGTDLVDNAHVPTGTPTVEYRAPFLTLINVKASAMWVEADIASYVADISQISASPWMATQDKLPGLFR